MRTAISIVNKWFNICLPIYTERSRLLVQPIAPFFIPVFVFIPSGRHALLEARFGYSTFCYFTWKFGRSASHGTPFLCYYIIPPLSPPPAHPSSRSSSLRLKYHKQELQPFNTLVSNYMTYNYTSPRSTPINADRISCAALRDILSL